jgi:uncharacterized membrane-anchored protein
MDINAFFVNNATAVIGLIGVLAGALITSIPIVFLQLLQRRWFINDEKRNWRRNRLLHRLSPIQDWLDATLRFSKVFAIWFYDDNNNKKPAEFINVVEEDLARVFKDHQNNEAIIFSHAVSTGDEELLALIKSFSEISTEYIDSLTANDNNKLEASRILLDAMASKAARRIEFLIEQARPIGGPYHKKSIHRFFRRNTHPQG